MNIEEIRELIQAVCESGVTELELERTGVKIRIRKESSSTQSDSSPLTVESSVGGIRQPLPEAAAAETPASPATPAAAAAGPDLHLTRSPIVGTFYRAAKPDADPFVQVGDPVDSETVVCILEAMKLMNEIEAGVVGEIVEIYVNNGEPVEFNQALFGIRPKGQS